MTSARVASGSTESLGISPQAFKNTSTPLSTKVTSTRASATRSRLTMGSTQTRSTTHLGSSLPAKTSSLRGIPTSFQPSSSSATSSNLSSSSASSLSSSEAQSSSQAALSGPNPEISLSNGQIAGITVGGVFLVLLVVGLVLLAGYFRRRRHFKRDSDFVGLDGENCLSSEHTMNSGKDYTEPNSSANFGPSGPPVFETPTAFTSKDRQSTTKPSEIGLALSPEFTERQPTPRTMVTSRSRTASKLLPDKPVFKPPTPLIGRPRPVSEATLIEDERASFHGSVMTGSSCRTSLEWAGAQTLNNPRTPHPPIRPALPRHKAQPPLPPPPAVINPRTPKYAPKGDRSCSNTTSSTSNSRSSSRNTDPRLSALLRLYTSQPHSRHSTASETSFETTGEDEGRDDTALSPLRESPNENEENRSPISPSRLNYPPVPRPLSGRKPVQTESPPPLNVPGKIPPRENIHGRFAPAIATNSNQRMRQELDLLAERQRENRAAGLRVKQTDNERSHLGPTDYQARVVNHRRSNDPPYPASSPASHQRDGKTGNDGRWMEARDAPSEWAPRFTPMRRGDELFL
ncbi:MAG: hypothetical protein M1837_006757 [Sclerophora amabilis]|nr:MAG: hypothetical protein M1837_006757 [Sclerophora amabilis]